MGSHSRVHYMDNLRAFAMLLGIFFHAALAYSPMLHQLWPTSDQENAALVDILAFFTHTFRMPLFFIIAGFFTALLISKRGLSSMFKNRLMRVTLPLAIFLPLILVSFAIIFGWAMESIENKSPLLGMIAMMAHMPEAPKPPVTTTHLWFLYNLTFFYLLAVLAAKFINFDWAQKVFNYPKLFLLLSPLLIVPALVTQHAPFPAPEQFAPQLWSFGFYGLLFLLGCGLYKNETFLDSLRPYLIYLLATSIIAYGIFYSLLPKGMNMQQVMENAMNAPELTSKNFALALLQAIPAIYMSLSLLIIGKTWMNKQSIWVRKIADSSYWIYIIHLPVLWVIQFLLLDVQLPLIIEFLISAFGKLFIGYISYLLLVKPTPIGWLLNGKKKPSNS